MGEKISTLAYGRALNSDFEIELNHPTIAGQDQQVHIQTGNFRFEMNKSDYIRYSMAILLAEKNLKKIKRIS